LPVHPLCDGAGGGVNSRKDEMLKLAATRRGWRGAFFIGALLTTLIHAQEILVVERWREA
jgi:hypothetical protein